MATSHDRPPSAKGPERRLRRRSRRRGGCERCGGELIHITMVIDGDDLVMESCERCDTRRWRLGGEPIDLRQALAKVGQQAARRR